MVYSLQFGTGRALAVLLLAFLALLGLGRQKYDAETRQLIFEMKKNDAEIVPEEGFLDDVYDDQIRVLRALAEKDSVRREKWNKKLIETLRTSIVSGYSKAREELQKIYDELTEQAPGSELAGNAKIGLLEMEYNEKLSRPMAFGVVQNWWIQSLEAFVLEYPKGECFAEAKYHLALAEELSDNDRVAFSHYVSVVESGVDNVHSDIAQGAIKRLSSVGKRLTYSGPSALDPAQVISTDQYVGKHVLIHFWATWSQSSIVDMRRLRTMQESGCFFAAVGVNLDSDPDKMREYFIANPPAWEHIFSDGGFKSASATDLGIVTVPVNVLLDPDGKVISQDITISEFGKILEQAFAAPPAPVP